MARKSRILNGPPNLLLIKFFGVDDLWLAWLKYAHELA